MKTSTSEITEPAMPAGKAIDWDKLGGPIPGFDCLKMKDEAQARILAELAGMTPDQELAYWSQRHAELLARQAEMRQKLAE